MGHRVIVEPHECIPVDRQRASVRRFISPGGMVRVAIIGGTGHIGSFLTPRLVEAGHSVICISRGLKEPYRSTRPGN